MKEVRISPSPNMELCVRITDQMEKDFRECQEMAAKEEDGADCNACSWRKLVLDNGSQEIAACTLPEVIRELKEERDGRKEDHLEDA